MCTGDDGVNPIQVQDLRLKTIWNWDLGFQDPSFTAQITRRPLCVCLSVFASHEGSRSAYQQNVKKIKIKKLKK